MSALVARSLEARAEARSVSHEPRAWPRQVTAPLNSVRFLRAGSWEVSTKGIPLKARSPVVPFYPFLGESSPTKIDYTKKGTLILTSLLLGLRRKLQEMGAQWGMRNGMNPGFGPLKGNHQLDVSKGALP